MSELEAIFEEAQRRGCVDLVIRACSFYAERDAKKGWYDATSTDIRRQAGGIKAASAGACTAAAPNDGKAGDADLAPSKGA